MNLKAALLTILAILIVALVIYSFSLFPEVIVRFIFATVAGALAIYGTYQLLTEFFQ